MKPYEFDRVDKKFEKNRIGQSHVSPNKGKDPSDTEKSLAIGNFFVEFPFPSFYEAKELKIPKGTIQWYLKKKLKMYPYKFSLCQALSQAHEAGRLTFCEWLLSQPDPFEFVQLVIFGDEKWFTLTQHPNRQNTRYWSVGNPQRVSDTNIQGYAKVQAFVCVVDGRVLKVVWHVKNGQNVSVNTNRYCKVIDEMVAELSRRDRHRLWWQQDGATCHTSTPESFRFCVLGYGNAKGL